jgi:hypothetical protein
MTDPKVSLRELFLVFARIGAFGVVLAQAFDSRWT